jgi:hypothetical protein
VTVKAELQFVTDAAVEANKAADAVARFRSELEKLQGTSGTTNLGGGPSAPRGQGGLPPGVKVGADGRMRDAKGRFLGADAQAQINSGMGGGGEQFSHAEKIAQIQAQSNAEHASSQHRIAEQYQKDRNAILVSGAAASHSLMAKENAHVHKLAEIEKKGALDTTKLRVKGEEDRARIAAKAAADEARDARKVSLRKTPGGTSKLGGALESLIKGGGVQGSADQLGGKAGVIAAIGIAAVGAAAKVASLSVEFGQAVVGAQVFKEDIVEALKTVRGTNEAADATFRTAIGNADKLGIKRADSIATFLDLATKGFDDAKIKEIQGRLLDITTIDPRASVEGLTKIIGKVAAQGRLTTDILSELSTAGLEQGDVIREIGKSLGKTDVEVIKALSSNGGIRGLGVDPILKAIAAQTGGGAAGDKAAEKANRNLSSLIQRIEDIPANVLFDVAAGPGIDSIKESMRQIIGYFDVGSETGHRVRKVVGDLFNALTEGLFGKRIGDEKGVTGTLNNIVAIAEKAVPVVKELSTGVGSLARALLAIGSGDTKGLDDSTKRMVGMINLVKEFGLLMAPGAIGGTFGPGGFIQPILDILGVDADATEVRKWVDAVAGLLNPMNIVRTIKASFTGGDTTLGNPILQALNSALTGAASSAIAGATSLGGDIVNGLISGIQSGLSRIGSMAVNMGSTVIASVRGALDSHSPARELIKVGLDATTGLAIGGERGTPMVAGAFSSMAMAGLMAAASVPPLPMTMPIGMSGASSSAMMLPSSGTAPAPFTFAPVIQVTVADGSDGDAIASALEERLKRMMPDAITAYLEAIGGPR